MSTEIKPETLPRSWYGELKEENIERVAAMIRERLEGRTFSIASVSVVNRPDPRLELKTGCKFESSWVDGNKEQVRVMTTKPAGWSREEGGRWLGFSAGGWFWSFRPKDEDGTRFSFDYDGFEVRFQAPCGDGHKHYFRAEPEAECPLCWKPLGGESLFHLTCAERENAMADRV